MLCNGISFHFLGPTMLMTLLLFLICHHRDIFIILYTLLCYTWSYWHITPSPSKMGLWARPHTQKRQHPAPNWRGDWWGELQNHLPKTARHVPETDWVTQEGSQHWQLMDEPCCRKMSRISCNIKDNKAPTASHILSYIAPNWRNQLFATRLQSSVVDLENKN